MTADFLVSNYPMPGDCRDSAFFPKMEAALQPSSPRAETPFKDHLAPKGPTGPRMMHSPRMINQSVSSAEGGQKAQEYFSSQ